MKRKNPFPEFIAKKQVELKTCDHRSRDRIRRELKVLKTANEMRRNLCARRRAA